MSSSITLPTFPSVPHRFGGKTTTEEVLDFYKLDLSGKNAIVTGGYSGIGAETVKALLSVGVNVVVPARSIDKAQPVIEEIKKQLEGNKNVGKVEIEQMDLSSLESVRNFAKKYNEKNLPLHLLIDNAGVMLIPTRELTVDGWENQLAVNHLGHFLLTNLLLPSLRRGAPSRVIVVSSLGHACWYKGFNFEDINYDKNYDRAASYGRSKMANVLFAKHFNKLYQKEGIIANAVHPGTIQTNLARHMTKEDMDGFANDETFKNLVWKTPSQGAATSVYVALSPELDGIGGQYFEDVYFVEIWNKDQPLYGTIPEAFDEELEQKLWDFSVKATKLDEQ